MITLDQTIKHQLDLERFKASLSKKLATQLVPIINEVNNLLGNIDGSKKSVTAALVAVNKLIDANLSTIEEDVLEEIREWLEAEIRWVATNEDIDVTEEEADKILAVILASLVRGKTTTQWFRGIKNNIKTKIRTEVLTGISDKVPLSSIQKSIKGVKSRGFKDGIWDRILRDITGTIHTTIQNHTNKAKEKVWLAAGVKKYIWLSVLDSRTTAICRGRSNKIYTVGQGPLPPAHFRCRSVVKRYTSGMEIPQSYSQWLSKQPRSTIEDILGKSKADLFIKGKLKLDKYVTPSGRELTLKEIKNRMSQ